MAARSPVITGLGIVSAAGIGLPEVWRSIASGTSGLRPLTLFSSPRYGQILAGEIQHDLLALGAPRAGSRSDRLGWLAAREALQSAGLAQVPDAERAGVVLGSSVGGSHDSERFLSTLLHTGRMRAGPTRYHECVSTVDRLAHSFGCEGPSLAVATACSSGALALAAAAELILAGEADLVLAGGADSLSRMTWGGFHSLLLVDAAGCRPFDAQRGGMSLGEGAGILVVEAEETAARRGAPNLARLSGWGASCDAYHPTAPHPEGAGALAAMRMALRRAGLEPAAVDYVNAHGTGTKDNDVAEARALRQLFEGRVPPFSSTKRFFGHALAASGAMEAVVCVEALRRQQMPPNPGFLNPDPAIGLEPIPVLRPASIRHVLSNSFGFGGNNAVLLLSHPEAVARPRPPGAVPVRVLGLGLVGPGAVTVRAVDPPLPPGQVLVHDCGTLPDLQLLSPLQRRRAPRLVQMALIAARRSLGPAATATAAASTSPAALPLLFLGRTPPVAVALGTGLGALHTAAAFIENLIVKEEREPMPTLFPSSVHNASAGQVAMDLGAQGLNAAPTTGETSFEWALWLGLNQLQTGEAGEALVGAVDELDKYFLALGRRWQLWSEGCRPGEGAVMVRLGPEHSTTGRSPGEKREAQVARVRLGRYRRPLDAAREADWIAASVDLSRVETVVSGAGGYPSLDPLYLSVFAALQARAGRTLEHQSYKQLCGEFQSASAFGFARALELIREGRQGVLLYTLSLRGAKALSLLVP